MERSQSRGLQKWSRFQPVDHVKREPTPSPSPLAEIEKKDFNLNISRYISTVVGEAEIDLQATHGELVEIEQAIAEAKHKHNNFLRELGLSPLP